MADESNFIHLSDKSVDDIRSLCDLVARKNRRNERSRTMAIGIAEYAEHHGLVSRKQAEWLARNADFHNQPRPEELCDLSYARKEPDQGSLFEQYDDPNDLISALASIRRELDEVVSRLRS